ncbi:3'-5' exoribonuclease [Brevibacillus humidisoli]|uniref:exonuclease domain-containing protein n=1 Tax=Brevibacillus humidisoli TaxID=2895522 RepID=UPI001E56D20E|nr:exonuclease domain-containing protein [Brevibacillus humidisoli]UFJ41199.1 3'-5' exoribonuclease [Brevibacillus humidisoli]
MKQGWNPLNRLWNQQRRENVPASLSAAMPGADLQHQAFLRSMTKDVQQTKDGSLSLDDLEAVVVDLETTGFRVSQGDEIIAIGAIAVRGTTVQEEETFFTLVHTNRSIPEHVQNLTGLSPSQLAGAPTLLSALSAFFQFVGDRPLVAHHSLHERQFLHAALWKTSRSRFVHRLIDTIVLIRICEEAIGDTTLDALCARNQIPVRNRHHAYWDAHACAHLWTAYMRRVIDLGYRDLMELYRELR